MMKVLFETERLVGGEGWRVQIGHEPGGGGQYVAVWSTWQKTLWQQQTVARADNISVVALAANAWVSGAWANAIALAAFSVQLEAAALSGRPLSLAELPTLQCEPKIPEWITPTAEDAKSRPWVEVRDDITDVMHVAELHAVIDHEFSFVATRDGSYPMGWRFCRMKNPAFVAKEQDE